VEDARATDRLTTDMGSLVRHVIHDGAEWRLKDDDRRKVHGLLVSMGVQKALENVTDL